MDIIPNGDIYEIVQEYLKFRMIFLMLIDLD
jgi:hypothetical protein